MKEVLIVLIHAAHLLCVNVAGGGPLVCLWLEWRESRGDALAGRAGRFLAVASVPLLVVGILLGVALGWMLWSPMYQQVISDLGSRITWGIAEVVFSLVLLGLYAAWWRYSVNTSRWSRIARAILPLAACTNLLYHFPLLFVIIGQFVSQPDYESKPIDSAAFRSLLMNGEVLARAAHFWVASLAVSGVALMVYALRIGRREDNSEDTERIAIWGGRIALVPTLLQIPIGLWVLLNLPNDGPRRLMGDDLAGTILLGLSVVLALLLMHQLSSVAMGNTKRSALIRSVVVMILIVVLMTGTLRRAKTGAHADEAIGQKREPARSEVTKWQSN